MHRRTRIALLWLAAGASLLFLYRVRGILLPFVLGGILAYLLNPLVMLLERKQVPRALGILIVYAFLGVVLFLAGTLILPQLTREVEEILQALPQQTRRLEGLRQDVVADFQRLRLPETVRDAADGLVGRTERLVETFAVRLAELMLGLLARLWSLVLAPVLAFYLLKDWERIRSGLLNMLPGHVRHDALSLVQDINEALQGFIRGQLIVSLAVGTMAAVGLSLFGVPYAVLIGVIAGVFDIIPYFGAVIGSIPGVALGLLQSPVLAFWIALMFVAIHQVESAIISPKVVGTTVGLHPLVVIFAVLAGGELFGILGMLAAVPVASAVKALCLFAGRKLVA